MFTFSNPTSKTQSRPSLGRFRTFNGWTSTVERMRTLSAPPAKRRTATLWLRRANSHPPIQRMDRGKTTSRQSISPPLPLNYSPFGFMVPPGPMSPCQVETSVPVGSNDYQPFCCTKVVLVASADTSRPCRIRRINTRKELPWVPISKPLPPLPSSSIPDSGSQLVADVSHFSTAPRNSVESDVFDDGLDDLSVFLRRIAYDVISASTIHRHLGFMEDGGRVLPLGRTTLSVRRSIGPPRRYSSLMGVSLAIMEGRLPKALMVM